MTTTHMGLAEQLLDRISAKTACVAVIGLGYVGLPLLRAFWTKGFPVLGCDIDPEKIESLKGGSSYIHHLADAGIAEMAASPRFAVTADFSRLTDADAIIICVPTPLTPQREPDMRFVVATADAVAAQLKPGRLVVLESTSYPGTTESVVRPLLESRNLKSERDFFLAFSPEREDPGNPIFHVGNIPKVVGGDGPQARRLAEALFAAVTPQVVAVSSAATAEAVKLTENIFRSVNIALVNELKVVFDAMGIDIWEVIEAAKTKPFGFMPFYPGPGLGGHCIPIDPFYLAWKAREYDVPTRFIELAGEINTAMPHYVVERLARALDERFGKGLSGAVILMFGLAYKKNVNDTRESPGLKLIELLEARGAQVDYHDPLVPLIPPTRHHASIAGRKSVALETAHIGAYDAALIVTDHDSVDYTALVAAARLVVDTRNATKHVRDGREKIVSA